MLRGDRPGQEPGVGHACTVLLRSVAGPGLGGEGESSPGHMGVPSQWGPGDRRLGLGLWKEALLHVYCNCGALRT